MYTCDRDETMGGTMLSDKELSLEKVSEPDIMTNMKVLDMNNEEMDDNVIYS